MQSELYQTKRDSESKLEIIYNKEYWYVSAFINSENFDVNKRVKQIKEAIVKKLKNLNDEDLPEGFKEVLEEKQDKDERKNWIFNLARNITVECEWIPHISNFPYNHENIHSPFDELGSIQFEVEYFKDNPKEKEKIEPLNLQQIAIIALKELERQNNLKFNNKDTENPMFIDCQSPIYICVTSKEKKPESEPKISWNQENIQEHKKMLGKWTEIYSGDWEDYSEKLYESRVESNLSNRESELHYLGTNSGLIYMEGSNYDHCFDSYMRECILVPTAKIRAILFTLLSINESLDILSDIQQEETKKRKERSLESRIEKLEVIRNLRQNIQEQMGFILNELTYNRRYHQTFVIKHLMKQFQIEKTYERITNKFEIIYDSIQNESLKHQLKQERNLQYLNILIIASVIAQVLQFIITATSGVEIFLIVLNIFGILLLIAFLIYVLIHVRIVKSKEGKEEKPRTRTVDVIIQTEKPESKLQSIIVIKRKNTPYRGMYALPGRFIDKNDDAVAKLVKRVKDEIGLDLKRDSIKQVGGEFRYDKTSEIVSTVYKCQLEGKYNEEAVNNKIKYSKTVSDVKLIPIAEIEKYNLAFNHEKMIEKAELPI